jgi:hypothetical protein
MLPALEEDLTLEHLGASANLCESLSDDRSCWLLRHEYELSMQRANVQRVTLPLEACIAPRKRVLGGLVWIVVINICTKMGTTLCRISLIAHFDLMLQLRGCHAGVDTWPDHRRCAYSGL